MARAYIKICNKFGRGIQYDHEKDLSTQQY
jgi:hypothetical protein